MRYDRFMILQMFQVQGLDSWGEDRLSEGQCVFCGLWQHLHLRPENDQSDLTLHLGDQANITAIHHFG